MSLVDTLDSKTGEAVIMKHADDLIGAYPPQALAAIIPTKAATASRPGWTKLPVSSQGDEIVVITQQGTPTTAASAAPAMTLTLNVNTGSVVPTFVPCSVANAALSEDASKCTNAFYATAINSKDVADSMASTVVSCLCSSRWNPSAQDMQAALQPTCPPPDGFSKNSISMISKGCKSNPFDTSLVGQGLGLKARLSSGDTYVPFTKTSNAHWTIPSTMFLGILCVYHFVMRR